jgi:hypothetical protein
MVEMVPPFPKDSDKKVADRPPSCIGCKGELAPDEIMFCRSCQPGLHPSIPEAVTAALGHTSHLHGKGFSF